MAAGLCSPENASIVRGQKSILEKSQFSPLNNGQHDQFLYKNYEQVSNMFRRIVSI
jgi:hypothetical protein